jgi:hypothetical protein
MNNIKLEIQYTTTFKYERQHDSNMRNNSITTLTLVMRNTKGNTINMETT